MRKVPLINAPSPTASADAKLKWLMDAVKSIGNASHIRETTNTIEGISDFIETLLDDETAEDAQATLELTDDQIALKAAVFN